MIEEANILVRLSNSSLPCFKWLEAQNFPCSITSSMPIITVRGVRVS